MDAALVNVQGTLSRLFQEGRLDAREGLGSSLKDGGSSPPIALTALEAWNVPFFRAKAISKILEERNLSGDTTLSSHPSLSSASSLRYLSLRNVFRGLCMVTERSLGLRLIFHGVSLQEAGGAPNVYRCEVYEAAGGGAEGTAAGGSGGGSGAQSSQQGEQHLGTIYVDLFAREHKIGGAAHFVVRCGKKGQPYDTLIQDAHENLQDPIKAAKIKKLMAETTNELPPLPPHHGTSPVVSWLSSWATPSKTEGGDPFALPPPLPVPTPYPSSEGNDSLRQQQQQQQQQQQLPPQLPIVALMMSFPIRSASGSSDIGIAGMRTKEKGKQQSPGPKLEEGHQETSKIDQKGTSSASDTDPTESALSNLPPSCADMCLTLSEVETMYHEWGHSMHSILSRPSFQHLSGTRVALDFAELPSHLMEYWSRDYRVVKLWALDEDGKIESVDV